MAVQCDSCCCALLRSAEEGCVAVQCDNVVWCARMQDWVGTRLALDWHWISRFARFAGWQNVIKQGQSKANQSGVAKAPPLLPDPYPHFLCPPGSNPSLSFFPLQLAVQLQKARPRDTHVESTQTHPMTRRAATNRVSVLRYLAHTCAIWHYSQFFTFAPWKHALEVAAVPGCCEAQARNRQERASYRRHRWNCPVQEGHSHLHHPVAQEQSTRSTSSKALGIHIPSASFDPAAAASPAPAPAPAPAPLPSPALLASTRRFFDGAPRFVADSFPASFVPCEEAVGFLALASSLATAAATCRSMASMSTPDMTANHPHPRRERPGDETVCAELEPRPLYCTEPAVLSKL